MPVTFYLSVRSALLIRDILTYGKARLQIFALCSYNATKYVCLWDPTFSAYLVKKRAEGKHYNVALSYAVKKLVRLIFDMEKSHKPFIAAA